MGLVQMLYKDLRRDIEEDIRKIPKEHSPQAEMYARDIAASSHYTLGRITDSTKDIGARVVIAAGCGGLVGLITGEPIKLAELAAITETFLNVSELPRNYIATRAEEWKSLPVKERRIKVALAGIGEAHGDATRNPLLSEALYILTRPIPFGIAGLLSGNNYGWVVGIINGAIVPLYQHLRAGASLKRVEEFKPQTS